MTALLELPAPLELLENAVAFAHTNAFAHIDLMPSPIREVHFHQVVKSRKLSSAKPSTRNGLASS